MDVFKAHFILNLQIEMQEVNASRILGFEYEHGEKWGARLASSTGNHIVDPNPVWRSPDFLSR